MAQHNAPQQLNDLLVAKNFDVNSLDSAGQPATDPSQAKVFNFNWVAESGKDYGTVVATIGENNDLTLYTGDNVGKQMEGDDKNEWFKFLEQMRMFAKRNLMTFSVQNLNKLKYSQQGQAAMKEGLHESWMGRKDRSWNAGPTEARLMIKHKRVIGENEARFRYIESLFIETADGERFKLPFTKLSAGKAMLEHVRQGGRPYDPRGNHIATIVTEMNLLARFRRANQGKIFEGEAATLVEQAEHHYENLRHTLKSLSTKTGYKKYFESWDPTALTDEDVIIEDLRCMFVEQNIDSRIEQALPLLSRLQKQEEAMKEIGIFEGWVNCLSEGTWALPDTPEKQQKLIQLLSDELPVGPDATNATELLYDLIGDDDLFDQLHSLAKEDANADARTVVINKLEQMASNPSIAQVIGKLKVEKQAPAPEAPAKEPVQESQVCETCQCESCECDHETVEEEINQLAELGGTGFQRVFHNGQWVDPKKIPQQVKELSPDTLKSYAKKAANSTANLGAKLGKQQADADEVDRYTNRHFPKGTDQFGQRDAMRKAMGADYTDINATRSKAAKRVAGIGKAVDRLTREDQLDELSPDTLGSYIKKASSDRAMRNFDQGVDTGSTFQDREPKFDWHNSRKDDQRRSGIHKAVNRLTTEEYQELAELSPNTLKSYIKKAASSSDERSASNLASRAADKLHSGGEDDGEADDHKSYMRSKGIARATDRLEELSPDTLQSYLDKGNADIKDRFNQSGDANDKKLANRLHGTGKAMGRLSEGGMSEADILFQELARGTVDMYDIYAHPKTNVEKFVSDQIHDRVEEITRDRPELMQDDDIDRILQIIHADLEDEYGIAETDAAQALANETVGGGNWLEETTALTGQYGHSGKLQAVQGTNADMMDRIKFLAGITK